MSDPGDTHSKIVEGSVTFSWETLPELAKNRWEEAVAFDVTIENRLVKAKPVRVESEGYREKIMAEVEREAKEALNRARASRREVTGRIGR